MDMYTLVYLKWITNKDPLYITENYIQQFAITYKGKEYINMYVFV